MRRAPTGLVVFAAAGLLWAASPLADLAAHSQAPAIAFGLAPRAIAAPTAGELPPPVPAGTVRQVVHVHSRGLLREVVDVAPATPEHRPLPLVIVLHGRRQTPWRAERVEGWDRYAATGQAVIAYPAGYAGSWDAGRCCGPAARHRLDDVGFVVSAIRLEEQRHAVDPTRVFLVGFSNGGMLAYDVACTDTRLVSAVAVVAGALETPTCRPSRPLSVLDIQGGRDRIVPYSGTAYSIVAGAPISSVAASLRPWQRVAKAPAVVGLVRLAGLGHEWPTVRRARWDATTRIWQFFLRHPEPTS